MIKSNKRTPNVELRVWWLFLTGNKRCHLEIRSLEGTSHCSLFQIFNKHEIAKLTVHMAF